MQMQMPKVQKSRSRTSLSQSADYQQYQQQQRQAQLRQQQLQAQRDQSASGSNSQSRFDAGPRMSLSQSFDKENVIQMNQNRDLRQKSMQELGSAVMAPCGEDPPPNRGQGSSEFQRGSTTGVYEIGGPAADRTTWQQECQGLVEQVMRNQQKVFQAVQTQMSAKKRVEQLLVPVGNSNSNTNNNSVMIKHLVRNLDTESCFLIKMNFDTTNAELILKSRKKKHVVKFVLIISYAM